MKENPVLLEHSYSSSFMSSNTLPRLLTELEIMYRPGKCLSTTLHSNTAHKNTRHHLVTEADDLRSEPQSTLLSLLSKDLRMHCKRKRTDKCNSTDHCSC